MARGLKKDSLDFRLLQLRGITDVIEMYTKEKRPSIDKYGDT